METLLKLENVSKRYGRETVLKDVNLELKKGEIVGLVGSNGAGKSTIMKIICVPQVISIRIFGDFCKDAFKIYGILSCIPVRRYVFKGIQQRFL